MDKFSLNNYARLSDTQKVNFNRTLAIGLKSMLDEIKTYDDLISSLIDEFITLSGQCSDSVAIVEELYSKISSGIQAGSGNQPLFLGILAKFAEAWEVTN